MTASGIFLMVSMIFSALSFIVLRISSLRGGKSIEHATPRGSAAAGVLYAFTYAFAPWAKESARRHLPSYLAGIVYHFAIFTMIVLLVLTLFALEFEYPADIILASLIGAGLLCGAGLLFKRILLAKMRAISIPDDFFSNLIVDIALAAGIVYLLHPPAAAAFQIIGGLLAIYAPFSKLKHMVFLFTSRRYVGRHFGRRGVKPHARPLGATHG
ncbi:MAG TPA: hypothetical protein VMX35_12840 [Acidobacteriota bacterium]|nr:hypothetical protein [Acidobacteriota bacterium]